MPLETAAGSSKTRTPSPREQSPRPEESASTWPSWRWACAIKPWIDWQVFPRRPCPATRRGSPWSERPVHGSAPNTTRSGWRLARRVERTWLNRFLTSLDRCRHWPSPHRVSPSRPPGLHAPHRVPQQADIRRIVHVRLDHERVTPPAQSLAGFFLATYGRSPPPTARLLTAAPASTDTHCRAPFDTRNTSCRRNRRGPGTRAPSRDGSRRRSKSQPRPCFNTPAPKSARASRRPIEHRQLHGSWIDLLTTHAATFLEIAAVRRSRASGRHMPLPFSAAVRRSRASGPRTTSTPTASASTRRSRC